MVTLQTPSECDELAVRLARCRACGRRSKTFVAAEVAMAVAGGGPAFGRYPAQRTGAVLFYGPEDGTAALRRRSEALAQSRGRSLSPLPI